MLLSELLRVASSHLYAAQWVKANADAGHKSAVSAWSSRIPVIKISENKCSLHLFDAESAS